MARIASITFALALASAVAAQNDKVRPGPWPTAAKIPPGWVVHNTKNYHVQSEVGIEKAKRLGDHMEVMNIVYRKMFKPDKDGAKQQTIKLMKDEATYHAYGGPQGSAAYYMRSAREMVCYDSGRWSDEEPATAPTTGAETPAQRRRRQMERLLESKMDLLGTAAHEGWHQYFDWYVGSPVELPSWIDEGMGDYFYAASPLRGKDQKKGAVELGRLNFERLPIVIAARRQDALAPIDKFLLMLQNEYYANPGLYYAEGWALCQFMLHGANGKYAKLIPNYVRTIRSDSNWKVVTDKVFKGIDMAAMHQEFLAFCDTMKAGLPDPFADDEGEKPAGEGGEAGGTPAPTPQPGGAGTGTGGG